MQGPILLFAGVPERGSHMHLLAGGHCALGDLLLAGRQRLNSFDSEHEWALVRDDQVARGFLPANIDQEITTFIATHMSGVRGQAQLQQGAAGSAGLAPAPAGSTSTAPAHTSLYQPATALQQQQQQPCYNHVHALQLNRSAAPATATPTTAAAAASPQPFVPQYNHTDVSPMVQPSSMGLLRAEGYEGGAGVGADLAHSGQYSALWQQDAWGARQDHARQGAGDSWQEQQQQQDPCWQEGHHYHDQHLHHHQKQQQQQLMMMHQHSYCYQQQQQQQPEYACSEHQWAQVQPAQDQHQYMHSWQQQQQQQYYHHAYWPPQDSWATGQGGQAQPDDQHAHALAPLAAAAAGAPAPAGEPIAAAGWQHGAPIATTLPAAAATAAAAAAAGGEAGPGFVQLPPPPPPPPQPALHHQALNPQLEAAGTLAQQFLWSHLGQVAVLDDDNNNTHIQLEALLSPAGSTAGVYARRLFAGHDRSSSNSNNSSNNSKMGSSHSGGKQVAIKVLCVHDASRSSKLLHNEVSTLQSVKGKPGFAQYHGFGTLWSTQHSQALPCIVMEQYGGSVSDILLHSTASRPLPLWLLQQYTKQVLQMLVTLHSGELRVAQKDGSRRRSVIVHGDVKAANLLVKQPHLAAVSGALKPQQLYVCDFGGSVAVPTPKGWSTKDYSKQPVEVRLSQMTPYFASPAAIQGLPVGPECDCHAVGVLVMEMCMGGSRSFCQLVKMEQQGRSFPQYPAWRQHVQRFVSGDLMPELFSEQPEEMAIVRRFVGVCCSITPEGEERSAGSQKPSAAELLKTRWMLFGA